MAIGKKTGGRVKGTPNKTTALLKDAIIEAANAVGEDLKGKDGLLGYCKFLAKEEPKAFSQLLGKVLPTQVTGENGEPIKITQVQLVALGGHDNSED
jgi:hypothetical protein